jgi:DNA polymerase bacteriophage-type
MLHIDFETRSCADLRAVGAWEYSRHPSTEVICLVWKRLEWSAPKVWVANPFIPPDYGDFTGMIAAFNSWFERSIWENIMVPRYGAPPIPSESWFCVAAQARAASLPGSLEESCKAMGVEVQKDSQGHMLMMKMCKPKRKAPAPVEWHESPEEISRLVEYCKTDVEAEISLYNALPPMDPWERDVWLADQAMNRRGFQVDIPTVTKAIEILERNGIQANKDIKKLTEGEVSTTGQVAAIQGWCHRQGVTLPNITLATVAAALAGELPQKVREVLELRKEFGLASVKKYTSMKASASPEDHRVRGGLRYSGAARTRRWSGQLVQPQNMARGFSDPELIQLARSLILGEDEYTLGLLFPSITAAMSGAMRGMVIAADGYKLVVSDYAAIEARITAQVCGCTPMLEDYQQGRCAYRSMASTIFRKPYEEVNKDERFVGKQAILGLGYGMGPDRYRESCANYGRDLDASLCKAVVEIYRERNHQIPAMWRKIEEDVKAAVHRKLKINRPYYKFHLSGEFLVMTLPSGSERFYLRPALRTVEKFGRDMMELTYMGTNTYTRKWERSSTYGAKLLENLVQSIARDVQAEAVLALHQMGQTPVLQVHDEIICEVPDDSPFGFKDLENIMETACSRWALGWPIKATGGWEGKFYRKD